MIAGVIEGRHGFRPQIVCLTGVELRAAAAENPFKQAEANHKELHLVFLAAEPSAEAVAGLAKHKTSDAYAVIGKRLYLHTPGGLLASKIAGRPEKLLGVGATARNWRTVTALLELCA
jgi:uncharacterized protein (DUF1697 family)